MTRGKNSRKRSPAKEWCIPTWSCGGWCPTSRSGAKIPRGQSATARPAQAADGALQGSWDSLEPEHGWRWVVHRGGGPEARSSPRACSVRDAGSGHSTVIPEDDLLQIDVEWCSRTRARDVTGSSGSCWIPQTAGKDPGGSGRTHRDRSTLGRAGTAVSPCRLPSSPNRSTLPTPSIRPYPVRRLIVS